MTVTGPELVSTGGGPTAPRPRLAWLDALRGIAVIAVVIQHGGELASRGFARVTHGDAQLGQCGVLLFFLVSGFVIPMALDRGPSLRRFAVTRAARLFPAYWFSILGVFLLWHLKVLEVPRPFRHDPHPWLANLTMVQTVLHQPQLQGQYWSLLFELIFYGACGTLLALGVHRHSLHIAWVALAGALALHVLARATGHHAPLGLGSVATMFVGSVLWRVHSGAVRPRAGWAVVAGGFAATQLILLTRFVGAPTDASTGVPLTLLPMAVAWGCAYAVFGLAFARRELWRPPSWLVRAGEVSYSVYLLHPLAMAMLGNDIHPAAVEVGLWLLASLALGWLGWRLVERPSTALGRVLAGPPLPR